MTLRKIAVFLAILCCLISSAKEYEKNIYIYRNDGKFSAFLSSEVDSLRYSRIDLDGIEHENNVIQEIWTPDSVYRIPLSVIDSISVVIPEIKYAPKVKHLNPDYTPYIKHVDDYNIDFALDMPYNLRINTGDILFYDKFDDIFPDGFAGRVISVTNNNLLNVRCEPVDLGDIYEQYIAVGAVGIDPESPKFVSSKLKAEVDGNVSVKLGVDSLAGGNGSVGVDARVYLMAKVTAFINKENKYIALDIIHGNNMEFEMSATLEKEWQSESAHVQIPLSNPISLVTLSAEAYALFTAKIEGSLNLKVSQGWESHRSIIYDNGQLITPSPQESRTPPTIDISAAVKGSISLKIPFALTFKTIGRTIEFSVNNPIGPVVDLEYEKSGSIDLTTTNGYSILKDASVNFALESQCKLKTKILSKSHDLTITPKFKLWERKFYFVPEFSEITLETDSKQISATTTASRPLLTPCKIGFRVFDEEDKAVDTYYDDAYDGLLPDPAKYELNATFTRDLKPGVKYKVRPLVKCFGKDFQAAPEEETYLDCTLTTGQETATTYSAEISGNTEVEFQSGTEVGFAYSASNKNPTVENSQHCTGQMINDNTFKGGFSGLRAGTTYYYRAYAFYNDQYYYGDPQCITTKKNCDHSSDDNVGGDFKKGRKPYASTGMSYEIEQRTAQIELTFNSVSPDTECGYYLEADDKRGSKILSKYYSLGAVTGTYTVELDNLIPGTTYRYWASERNSLGSYTGNPRTFKTEPSPDPVGTVIEVTDIDMKSATVRCHFDNMESDYAYGIILTDGKWLYSKTAVPDAGGNAIIKLDRLAAETDYTVSTYISTDPEEAPILEKKATKFSTEGPDITGNWGFTTSGVFGEHNYFDLEIRSNGKTNSFYGVNYCHWTRNGRNITLTLDHVVGGYESTAYYIFRGEFNEDFTVATGRAIYVHDAYWLEIYEELYDVGPFKLVRK